jgi:hypothetical protein
MLPFLFRATAGQVRVGRDIASGKGVLGQVALSSSASTIRCWREVEGWVRDDVWFIDGAGGNGAGEKQSLLKNTLAANWS